MKKLYCTTIAILFVLVLAGCGNLYSHEQIEQIKKEAVEEAKADILEENALNYVKENYTPEEVYPDKVVLSRGKTTPVYSTTHGTLPANSKQKTDISLSIKNLKCFIIQIALLCKI